MGKRVGAWASFALALFVALIALGCGGGGSTASVPGTNFFLSDAPASDYDQVWVRVFKVEAAGGSAPTTVFEDSEGIVLDLASLNDGAPRFAFLGSGDLPAGTTSLRIELDSQVALLPTGADQAEMAVFNPVHEFGQGHSLLNVPFAPAPGASDVVIDFDLSAWTVENGVIDPVVQIVPGNGVGSTDRHEEMTYFGSVSRLEGTAPLQSFVLTTQDGRMAAVTTSEATVVFDDNGAMASLANGQRVVVYGAFSAESNAILAGSIQILGGDSDRDLMLGRAFDPNFGSGTFLCEVKRVHGFVPNHRFVTVSTPEGTVFLAPSGERIDKERFYNAIEGGDKFVIAAGQYDGSTNLFTARVVKLHHRHDDRHEVRASGEILEIAPDRHAFILRVHEWHGPGDMEGERVKVVTGSETAFFGPDGARIEPATFYNRARPGTVVSVEGLYTDHVIRARKVQVRHWGENDSPDVAHGQVTEVNPLEFAFGMRLREWDGFDPPGDSIRVLVTETTVIMDREGHEFTREQFFREIRPGGTVSVFGHFDGHMTARKIIVHSWNDHFRLVGNVVEWNAEMGVIVVAVADGDPGEGHNVRVHVDAETQFFIGESPVTVHAFFAALTVGARMGVEGTLDDGGVLADTCRLLPL